MTMKEETMTVATEAELQRICQSLDAETMYAEAEGAAGLWKGEAEEEIHLFRGEVVESDSPGSGRSDEPGIEPFVQLGGDTVFRKLLHVDDPACDAAQIAFIAIEGAENSATLSFTVNGRQVLRPPSREATPEAEQYWQSWSRWYYLDIPADALRQGENELKVWALDGSPGWQLMVADYRDFHKGMEDPVTLPQATTRSDDGGRTWAEERGELVLRLALDRFRRCGELLSPVLDAAGEGQAAVRGCHRVASLRVTWESETPSGTELGLACRSGSCPSPDAGDWSDWQSCESGQPVADLRGRYLQWRAQFRTADPRSTPSLRRVGVEADVALGPEPPLRVASAHNPRILRSSWDMPHENPRCRLLTQLRRECELDAVVAGAQTEFDAVQRLQRWAYHIPLGSCSHFPWNALSWIQVERGPDCEIRMNEYDQRRRDRMCLYPNVVLVAALQSFGIPARHLNFHSEGMTGHEIAEAWSNDFGKWIHLDATRNYYWYDRKTLVPLDTEEIHRVLVDRLERVERWDRPYLYNQDLEALVADLPIAFWDGDYQHSNADGDHGALFLFRSFCHFRIVPRFDVFSRSRPLPVSQGTEVWSWDGYLNWAEDRVPPLPHMSQHTNRRADFYPTLNQTRLTVESTGDHITFLVHLETETPDFAAYEARVDRGHWRETAAPLEWSLHGGMNTLEVRSRNGSGWTGVVSSVSIVA